MEETGTSKLRTWEDVRDIEIALLRAAPPPGPMKLSNIRERLAGLAMSGGGIRSASFSLGVFQTLIRYGIVKRFHYLSTVSGGGYTGTAILWLRSLCKYDEKAWFAQITGQDPEKAPGKDEQRHGARTKTGIWLDFLRQHGNYLQPPGIDMLGMIGVGIRSLALSVGFYVMLMTILLVAIGRFELFTAGDGSCWESAWVFMGRVELSPMVCWDVDTIATGLLLFIPLIFILYSFGSFSLSFKFPGQIVSSIALSILVALPLAVGLRPVPETIFRSWHWTYGDWSRSLLLAGTISLFLAIKYWWDRFKAYLDVESWSSDNHLYRVRVQMQRIGGISLAVMLLLGLLALLPGIAETLDSIPFLLVALFAFSATSYMAIAPNRHALPKVVLTKVRTVAVFALIILFGSVSSYLISVRLRRLDSDLILFGIGLITLVVGFCTNLNQFGIGRMYRDRLMETFMPDLKSIESERWNMATTANGEKGLLVNLWRRNTTDEEGFLYPLINTNVVLVDSPQDTFRGRGGDSFVLSPNSCGSDATKWVSTLEFAEGDLKAGTAMAISGAAANPNAAPGGHGLSRNKLVSFLMFLAQARLGAWVRNPKASGDRLKWKLYSLFLGHRPNFICPGLWSGLFGSGLDESAYFLELTDGGHFDNTGVYELIRRRARVVVLAQASQDGEFAFADLANLTEKIRVDFGARLDFAEGLSLDGIFPKADGDSRAKWAEKGYAIGKIIYDDDFYGWLIYLQATPQRDISVDTHSYYLQNPTFPNEPTANQFFREAQLEAYRELGQSTAEQFLEAVVNRQSPPVSSLDVCLDEICAVLQPTAPPR